MGVFDTYEPTETPACFHCSKLMDGAEFQGKSGTGWHAPYVQGQKPAEDPFPQTGWEFYAPCPRCDAWNEFTITAVDGVWVSHTHDLAECDPPRRNG
jgi:phage FluMu protein Com